MKSAASAAGCGWWSCHCPSGCARCGAAGCTVGAVRLGGCMRELEAERLPLGLGERPDCFGVAECGCAGHLNGARVEVPRLENVGLGPGCRVDSGGRWRPRAGGSDVHALTAVGLVSLLVWDRRRRCRSARRGGDRGFAGITRGAPCTGECRAPRAGGGVRASGPDSSGHRFLPGRLVARYGQPVMLMDIDWHPFWISYEWWRDIGTGLLSVVGAVLIGASTVFVAFRSHALAKTVTERESRRIAVEAAERYDARLTSVVETAVGRVLDFVEHSSRTTEGLGTKKFALATALTLVHAVARGDDLKVTRAALDALEQSMDDDDALVRALVAGEIAGAITAVVARKDSIAVILGKIQTAVKRARARSRNP